MKNTIKMSLAAAVAVAGLTTSASAADLEKAIQGVDISGKINVGYEYQKTKETGEVDETSNTKEYDIDVTANIPVNDTITAQVGVQADHDPAVRDNNTDVDGSDSTSVEVTRLNFTAKTDVATVIVGKQSNPTPFLNDERGDGIVALIPAGPVTIAAGHFTGMTGGATMTLDQTDMGNVIGGVVANTAGLAAIYTDINTTAKAAAQFDNNITGQLCSAKGIGGILSAVADGNMSNNAVGTDEQMTAGLNALINGSTLNTTDNSGAVTIGTNLSDRDISALAVIGAAGPVNAQLWYLTASGSDTTANVENGLDGYSLMLDADIEGFRVEFAHSSLGLNGETNFNFDDETLTKLTVSTAVEGINLTAGYGTTNDAVHTAYGQNFNTRLHGVDLTDDDDARTNMAMDQLALDNLNDADAFLIGASTTMGQYTMGLAYLDGDTQEDNAKTDFNELDLTVSYAMSENFTVAGVYAMTEAKDATEKEETDTLSISATYRF